MRIKRKKSPALALMLALALGLASCGGGAADTDTVGDTVTGSDEPERTDMGGYVFSVNVRGENTGNGYFACTDFMAEEMNGDPINDAVYKRNRLIEDMYNCVIEQNYALGDQYDEISKAVMAGDAIEAGIVLGTSAAKLAQEGMLLNLYDCSEIDFSGEWWDQNAIEAFTIDGSIYFATGDLNISTNDSTRVTIFSKNIIADTGLDNPYELVREGKWTLGKMLEMALSANRDLNGDTKLTTDDQVGLYVYNWAPQFFFYGCGERVTTMNADGIPELTLYNDRSVDAVGLIWDICTESRTDTLGGFSSDLFSLFISDRCLFTQTSINDVRNTFRTNCEQDFGILPMPKLDEEQSRYYNLVSFQDVTHIWCIPLTCSDPGYAAELMEAFARESVDTTRKAYYDITLQGKVSRDDESSEMLDLIFQSRVYDISMLYNWGSWDSYFTGMREQTTNNFASVYESKLSATKADIDKTIESFRSN